MQLKAANWLIDRAFQLMIVLLLWLCLWPIVREESLPPRGNIFWLIVLFVVAFCGGEICSFINAPPLIGMLITGLLLRNTTSYFIDPRVSAILRSFALTVILLRAGFGLDPKVLRKLSGVCLRLSFTPCLLEALSAGITGRLLLGLPWTWGFLLGFVLAAVSPAVVVPQMIVLSEKKLGTNKGIPTLVIAASSVENVFAITGFGVLLGVVFSSGGSLVWQILQGPIETAVGVVLGSLIGVFLWFVHQRSVNDVQAKNSSPASYQEPDYYHTIRFTLSLLFGLVSVFVSQELKASSVGPLAALALAFIAGHRWRTHGYDAVVGQRLKTLWLFCEPFLFCLIGAEVDVTTIEKDSVLMCLIALLIGLIVRWLATVVVVAGAGLTMKERIFVALSWLPKATVQAVVGPVALDMARISGVAENIKFATLILNFAVISIIITAPLGALLISLTSSKLLQEEPEQLRKENSDANNRDSVEANNEVV